MLEQSNLVNFIWNFGLEISLDYKRGLDSCSRTVALGFLKLHM